MARIQKGIYRNAVGSIDGTLGVIADVMHNYREELHMEHLETMKQIPVKGKIVLAQLHLDLQEVLNETENIKNTKLALN